MVLIKLFRDLSFRFPWHFILLFLFIFLQSVLNILSVIAVAPLTDYLLERQGTGASKITQYLENLFLSLGISFDLLQVCIFFGLI